MFKSKLVGSICKTTTIFMKRLDRYLAQTQPHVLARLCSVNVHLSAVHGVVGTFHLHGLLLHHQVGYQVLRTNSQQTRSYKALTITLKCLCLSITVFSQSLLTKGGVTKKNVFLSTFCG